MGLYARYLLPHIVNRVCRSRPTMRQRAKLIPAARGRVLEVGIGSGLNLSFYDARSVERLWGLDPSPEMWALAEERRRRVGFEVDFIVGSADAIPLDDNEADTVVLTYTLCSLPDVGRALAEIHRVLRPDGHLLFCEHGTAPDASVRKWQNRMNPLWRAIGGGCHLNRHVPSLLEGGGFRIRELKEMYLPGWKPASYNFLGAALPATSTDAAT